MAVTYTRGKPGELGEIRDFVNMVFSMHTRPHDFARMLPKLYADDAATEGEHYLVREDGRAAWLEAGHPRNSLESVFLKSLLEWKEKHPSPEP